MQPLAGEIARFPISLLSPPSHVSPIVFSLFVIVSRAACRVLLTCFVSLPSATSFPRRLLSRPYSCLFILAAFIANLGVRVSGRLSSPCLVIVIFSRSSVGCLRPSTFFFRCGSWPVLFVSLFARPLFSAPSVFSRLFYYLAACLR